MVKGWFFITVVTWKRFPWLAEEHDGRLLLTPAGVVAREEWLRLSQRFSSVVPGAFVAMPDHCHGLIHLNGQIALGVVVQRFKAAVTYKVRRQVAGGFSWQRNYFERRLRQGELNRYRTYIADNPRRWLEAPPSDRSAGWILFDSA